MAEETRHEPHPVLHRLGRGGYLHAVIPILDRSGQVIERVVKPLMVEVRGRDVVQIMVGSAILAIPVGFTEEAWGLGARLPPANIVGLSAISLAFIGTFVYTNFYRFYLKEYVWEYAKRVVVIYGLSLGIVGILLTLIQQCPWGIDNWLAVRRIVVVAFPASLSATVTDALS